MNRCMEMDHQWPGRDRTPRRPRVGMYPNGCPTRTGKPDIQQGQASPRGRGESRAGKPEPVKRKAGEAIHSQAIARVNQSIGTARGAGSPITSSEAQQASLALPMGGGPRWESHQLQTQEGAGSSPRSMQGYPAPLGSRNPTVCSKPVSRGLRPISGRRPRETDARAIPVRQ